MFNGTVGVVTALSTEEQSLTVRTNEDEVIDYDFDELDELAHACTCTAAHGGVLCSHLVWVGLTHLGHTAAPRAALAAEAAPAGDLRAWLGTLTPDELIDMVIQAAADNREYRRHLHLRARQS